ncbi:MAG: DUF1016 N-terminal domain-containing protein [Defluviitaleaceae bacterium]|nr:DUF1016 N-terminal domain-containing protein [Defluviitaleaceae bacterium]
MNNQDKFLPSVIDTAINEINVIDGTIDEVKLYEFVANIIETRKTHAYAYVNKANIMMFWEVGRLISAVILDYKRATYGKKILSELAIKLVEKYGKNFAERNIYRMMQFADQFSDLEILSTLSTKLSWSHFVELLPLKSTDARLFYANDALLRMLSVHELRRQISRKAYERQEIANVSLSDESLVPSEMEVHRTALTPCYYSRALSVSI